MTSQTQFLCYQSAFLMPSLLPPASTSSSFLSRPLRNSFQKVVRSHHPLHPRSSLYQPSKPPDDDSPTPNISQTATPASSSSLPNRWAVVSAASLVHALHAACVYLGPTTLMTPMRHSLNLSITQITQPLTAFRLVQAIFLVPSGYLLDKVGPQICLRVSLTVAALMAPLLPLVTSLSQLLWLQSLFGITKLFGGLSAMLLIAAQAFPDGKGLATATSILLSGYSLAGFIAPAFIGTLADTLGWRIAFLALSVIFIVVAVPLTFHFLRDRDPNRARPTISSLFRFASHDATTIDNAQSFVHRRTAINSRSWMKQLKNKQNTSSFGSSDKPVLSLRAPTFNKSADPLITKPYLLIATAVASFSFSMHIVFDHLIVFLGEDFGMSFRMATKYMSVLNLLALFGKLGVGPIADRYSKSLLISIFAVVAAIACLLLLEFTWLGVALTTSYFKVKTFIALYAIGYAAVFTLTTAILPELGKARLGMRSSFNFMVLFTSGSIGSYMAGFLRSHTGSYKWAFLSSALAWVVVGLAGFAYYLTEEKNNNSATESNSHMSNGEEEASKLLPRHPFSGSKY